MAILSAMICEYLTFPAINVRLSSALCLVLICMLIPPSSSQDESQAHVKTLQVCLGRKFDVTAACPEVLQATSGRFLRGDHVMLSWNGSDDYVITDARIHFRFQEDLRLGYVTLSDVGVTYYCKTEPEGPSGVTFVSIFDLEIRKDCPFVTPAPDTEVALPIGSGVRFAWDTQGHANTLFMTSRNDVIIYNGSFRAASDRVRYTKNNQTSSVSVSDLGPGDSGVYILHQGDANVTWRVVVVGVTASQSDLEVSEGQNLTLSWSYRADLANFVSLSVWKEGYHDNQQTYHNEVSLVPANSSLRFRHLRDACVLLPDITSHDVGTYHFAVTLRTNTTHPDMFVFYDDVTLSLMTSRSMWVDYPLLTGLCALGLVILIPVFICIHIFCGRTKTHLTPVNMHHGAYHGAGSQPSLAPGEIDPFILHARILNLRRERTRPRTASETTVESANEMWGFAETPPRLGYPRVHRGGKKYPAVKYWDANGNASV